MSRVESKTYWLCDICDDTIKVKGGIYPRSIGFKLLKKLGKAIGWENGDITRGSYIEEMHFCIDCWDKVVNTVHRIKDKH